MLLNNVNVENLKRRIIIIIITYSTKLKFWPSNIIISLIIMIKNKENKKNHMLCFINSPPWSFDLERQ